MLYRNIQLFIVIASTILALIATDIILPSLPQISDFFMAPANEVKMLISIYMIGQFSTVLLWGMIADQLGRRTALLLGMLLFLLGSLLSLNTISLDYLLLSRFLQGAGAVVAPVAGWALIQDLFPKDDGARILTLVGTLTAVIPLFAPALGGTLDILYGWQTNLYCITAYSLIVCVLLTCLPKSPDADRVASVPSVKDRFKIYGQIIKNKTFISYIVLFGLLNSGEWCFLTMAPFYYANKNIPADTTGILLMCTSMGFVCGSLLASKLFTRFGVDKIINLGIQLALISSTILIFGEYIHWSKYQLFNALIIGLYISSSALLWGGTTSRALQCFEDYRGSASAIRSLIILCCTSFGTYIGRLIPHSSLYPLGCFLLFMAFCTLVVFNNKELKSKRMSAETAI